MKTADQVVLPWSGKSAGVRGFFSCSEEISDFQLLIRMVFTKVGHRIRNSRNIKLSEVKCCFKMG